MSAIGKQCADYMLAATQVQCLAGGTIAHVNVISVFTDFFAEISGQININK